jgi:hypothetical protein
MLYTNVLILLGYFISLCSAVKPLGAQVCIASCYDALQSIVFTGPNGKACNSTLRPPSIFYCAKIHCHPLDLKAGIAWASDACPTAKGALRFPAYQNLTSNVTAAFLKQLPTVNLKENKNFSTIVVPSETAWNLAYRTVVCCHSMYL